MEKPERWNNPEQLNFGDWGHVQASIVLVQAIKQDQGGRSRPCALQSAKKNIFIKRSLLPGASNKSHNNGCIVIIDDYYYY